MLKFTWRFGHVNKVEVRICVENVKGVDWGEHLGHVLGGKENLIYIAPSNHNLKLELTLSNNNTKYLKVKKTSIYCCMFVCHMEKTY